MLFEGSLAALSDEVPSSGNVTQSAPYLDAGQPASDTGEMSGKTGVKFILGGEFICVINAFLHKQCLNCGVIALLRSGKINGKWKLSCLAQWY